MRLELRQAHGFNSGLVLCGPLDTYDHAQILDTSPKTLGEAPRLALLAALLAFQALPS